MAAPGVKFTGLSGSTKKSPRTFNCSSGCELAHPVVTLLLFQTFNWALTVLERKVRTKKGKSKSKCLVFGVWLKKTLFKYW